MKVLINGTTRGIGKAILAHGVENHLGEMIELNRAPGAAFDYEGQFSAITKINPDVFVNNVYGVYESTYNTDLGHSRAGKGEDWNPQLTAFYDVLELWQNDPSKTIINIGSMAAFYARTPMVEGPETWSWHRRYRSNKAALLAASEQAAIDNTNIKCRVSVINPGYVRTERMIESPRHGHKPMLDEKMVAEAVWWLIRLPEGVRVPSLPIFQAPWK